MASPSGSRAPHATTTTLTPQVAAGVSKAGYAMSAGMDDDAFVEKFVSLVQTKLDERCDGPHKLHDAFKYFDRSGVGRLDVGAFRAACERLMIHLTDHEAKVGHLSALPLLRVRVRVGVRVAGLTLTQPNPTLIQGSSRRSFITVPHQTWTPYHLTKAVYGVCETPTKSRLRVLSVGLPA